MTHFYARGPVKVANVPDAAITLLCFTNKSPLAHNIEDLAFGYNTHLLLNTASWLPSQIHDVTHQLCLQELSMKNLSCLHMGFEAGPQ